MHELSIALSLVEVAAQEAARHQGQVAAVHVRLGALAGVVKEALLSAWEMARLDSPLAGAELAIEEVAVVAYCATCEAERPIVSMQQFLCLKCGAAVRDIIHGLELELVALEVEE